MAMGNKPSSDIVEYARRYVEHGWYVIPLHPPMADGSCSCRAGKACDSAGKHPMHSGWQSDATVDAEEILRLWTQRPDANLAIVTGAKSGLVVVDVDLGADFTESIGDVISKFSLDPTYVVRTGRGYHLYYGHPGGKVRNRVNIERMHLDLRADGGFVVAPPSLHATGVRYTIEHDVSLAPLPVQFVERREENDRRSVDERRQRERRSESATVETSLSLRRFTSGERNSELTKLAGGLRASGLPALSIEALLQNANFQCCSPTLAAEEIAQIARSVAGYPVVKNSAGLPWFKFSVLQWQGDSVAMLCERQRGWYVSLRANSWQTGGVLPTDLKHLARLANAKSAARFAKECGPVLALFRVLTLSGTSAFIDDDLAMQYLNAVVVSLKKARAGRQSGAVRRSSPDEHVFTDTDEDVDEM